jgi:hypothetical protein
LRNGHEMQPFHLHRQQKRRNLHFEKSFRFRRRLGFVRSIPIALRLRLHP